MAILPDNGPLIRQWKLHVTYSAHILLITAAAIFILKNLASAWRHFREWRWKRQAEFNFFGRPLPGHTLKRWATGVFALLLFCVLAAGVFWVYLDPGPIRFAIFFPLLLAAGYWLEYIHPSS